MAGTILGMAGLDIAGEQSDRALWATARVGRHFDLDSVKVSPYVFSRIARQYLGAVDETGTSVLTLNAASATALTGDLGLGVTIHAKPIEWSDVLVTPSLNVAYGRRLGTFKRSVELLGSSIASKIDPSKDRVDFEADLLLARTASALEGKLSYQAGVSSDVISHTISANLNMKF